MKLKDALRPVDPRLLASSEGRKLVTKHDPLMFAAVYMPHKLFNEYAGETLSDVSLNDFHMDVIDYAHTWTLPLDIKHKKHDCFIAPRMTGKSTWLFHILPIWAGAHLHKRYIISFSDSNDQAKAWLLNFKTEIASNALLQEDYPEFCGLAKMSEGSRGYQDNRNITQRANGFVFQVAGADNNVAGANVGGNRPDVILFDDIEPTESNYSPDEARKRLNTVLSGHWYLNVAAVKVFIGTTTMPESIIDQMRKVGELAADYDGPPEDFREEVEPEHKWIVDNSIKVHYWPAILTNDDGSEESLWPEKWPMDELNSMRHTRSFAMNMMNKPISLDGGYWSEEDIAVNEDETWGNTIISVDPAVTTKRLSDYTGIAVLSRGSDGLLYVRHAEQVKFTSDTLADHVSTLIDEYNCGVLYVETNQGGDLWRQVFANVPCRVRTVRQTEKKELRAAKAHDIYRRGQVRHVKHFPALEEQMLAFPRVAHDDVLDAVVSGVLYFNNSTGTSRVREFNYMEV